MSKDHSHAHEPDLNIPLQEGEFHRISGIGPGIEKRLHTAGVKTFEQLASLSPEKLAGMLGSMVGVKPEIIARKDWIGQARRYAQELKKEAYPADVEAEEPAERQHYESYMVELLLDEEHTVRRTRITHVKDGVKDSWAGWEPGRVDSWIASKAGLRAAASSVPQPVSPAPSAGAPLPQPHQVQEPQPKALPVAGKPASRLEAKRLKGSLRIEDVYIIRTEENRASHFFEADRPLEVRLKLNLSDVQVDLPAEQKAELAAEPMAELIAEPMAELMAKPMAEPTFQYKAVVIARKLGTGGRSEQGQVQGFISMEEGTVLSIPVRGLAEGTYRLETLVLLYPSGALTPEKTALQAISEGKLVQVLATEKEFVN